MHYVLPTLTFWYNEVSKREGDIRNPILCFTLTF